MTKTFTGPIRTKYWVALLVTAISLTGCSAETEQARYRSGLIGDIPVIWLEPAEERNTRSLVIWQDGFTGNKENTLPILEELADMGYVALSFDNYQHGERAEKGDNLWNRVFARNSFRKGMWPIIGRSVEDSIEVIDWAVDELSINGEICMGGFSMGGDISVAVAGADSRVKCVAAIVSTPDWQRPNMRSFGNLPTLVPQGNADSVAQSYFDRFNPSTNVSNYAHMPAITFESGGSDQHIPASDARAFRDDLLAEFPDMLVRVVEHDADHTLSRSMWQNCKDWFASHLH